MHAPPTERQREVLVKIKHLTAVNHKVPPTVREVAEALGVKHPGIVVIIRKLREKGLLKSFTNKARAYVLTEEGKRCAIKPRANNQKKNKA